jgi:hypothetical protein
MGDGISLTDKEFMADWLAYFGTSTGPKLLGWLVLAHLLGSDLTERSLLNTGPMHLATRYRHVAELRGYAENLRARGLLVGASEPVNGILRGMHGLGVV